MDGFINAFNDKTTHKLPSLPSFCTSPVFGKYWPVIKVLQSSLKDNLVMIKFTRTDCNYNIVTYDIANEVLAIICEMPDNFITSEVQNSLHREIATDSQEMIIKIKSTTYQFLHACKYVVNFNILQSIVGDVNHTAKWQGATFEIATQALKNLLL